MESEANQITNIDEYISTYPEDIQHLLEQMRETIKVVAPTAVEAISYRLPTFKLNGNLVHFGAFKHHIGFYPTSSGITAFQAELASYPMSKGAVRFPIDQPLPLDLVRRITAFRVQENLKKKKK